MSERKVKCVDTGEFKPKSEAWRPPNSKKYYSSQEAWNNIQKQIKIKDECIDYLMDVLGYKPGMKLPTITYKKIEEYREPYGFDVLLDTMQQQSRQIEWALKNKNFQNETGKIMYLFAIFQNHAIEAWRNNDARENATNRKQEVLPSNLELSENTYNKTTKNITKFLDKDALWN